MQFHLSRQRFWQSAFMAIALGLAACSPSPQSQTPTNAADDMATADAPSVVATSALLCDLATQIAQDAINLTCLVEPGVDPHVYQPTPTDRRAIEDAQLVLYFGYNYESGLEQMIAATENDAPKIAVSEVAVPNPLMGDPHDHDHVHDDDHGQSHADDHGHDGDHADDHGHSHGADDNDHAEEDGHNHASDDHDHGGDHAHDDDHGHSAASSELEPDPHVWQDPQNGARMVTVIGNEIAALVPDQADVITERGEAIAADLTQLDDWIRQQVATIPANSRKLVTPHDSFQYFADAYDVEVAGTIEGLSTEAQPSATRMAELVDLVKEANVPAVFSEQTTNKQLIEALAEDAGVEVADRPLFAEGPGDASSPAPTYQAMFVSNTCTIVNALGGTCNEGSAPVGS